MSSQTNAIKCGKTMSRVETLAKFDRCIFDVTMSCSYITDSNGNNSERLHRMLAATVAGQIGHKYKQWKACSLVIAFSLYDEFERLELPSREWKGTISVMGQYANEDSTSDYSEIIYDSFIYDGIMTIPKISVPSLDVLLQYSIRFLLSPILPIAQKIYLNRGYIKKNLSCRNKCSQFQQIMNQNMNDEKEYNHLKTWQAIYDTIDYSLHKY